MRRPAPLVRWAGCFVSCHSSAACPSDRDFGTINYKKMKFSDQLKVASRSSGRGRKDCHRQLINSDVWAAPGRHNERSSDFGKEDAQEEQQACEAAIRSMGRGSYPGPVMA
jgi:hypothetical protein